MNCWIIGVTIMCAQGDGMVFMQNYNVQPDAHTRPAQIDYDAMYRSQGMRTNYEYFCKGPGRGINPADDGMCVTFSRGTRR